MNSVQGCSVSFVHFNRPRVLTKASASSQFAAMGSKHSKHDQADGSRGQDARQLSDGQQCHSSLNRMINRYLWYLVSGYDTINFDAINCP